MSETRDFLSAAAEHRAREAERIREYRADRKARVLAAAHEVDSEAVERVRSRWTREIAALVAMKGLIDQRIDRLNVKLTALGEMVTAGRAE